MSAILRDRIRDPVERENIGGHGIGEPVIDACCEILLAVGSSVHE